MKNLRNIAIDAVEEAQANPGQWIGAGDGDQDQVIFANATFTIGSNGNYEDFETAEDAVEALYESWKKEESNM